MGSNGTGKSTFGDVLLRLQWLLGQGKTDEVFPDDTLTRWQTIPRQRFEVDAIGPAGKYEYSLVVDHRKNPSADEPRAEIVGEGLSLNSRLLFEFQRGQAAPLRRRPQLRSRVSVRSIALRIGDNLPTP